MCLLQDQDGIGGGGGGGGGGRQLEGICNSIILFHLIRSAPEFPAGGGGVGTKRKTCLQPLEPSPVLESTRMQLLDPVNESEVEMFLQPPDEDIDTKGCRKGLQLKNQHSVIKEETIQEDEDAVKGGGSPVKGSSPVSQAGIMITVDDSSGVPISKESVLIKEGSITPAKVENESKDGAVVMREGASERRQLRRIRTNSQVETII